MGVPKAIPNAKRFEELFEEYRKDTKTNPIKKMVFVGRDGDQRMEHRERPLTMEGFENYLYKRGIISDLSDYFENKEGRYSAFVHICRAVKKIIRQDQIEGGMAMIYNPSITARINGLVEKKEVEVKEQPLFGPE